DRNHSRRCVSVRAHTDLQRDRHWAKWADGLCQPSEISGKPAVGIFPGTLRDLVADRLSRSIRLLHLVRRRVEHGIVSLVGQLDVHATALDRWHRVHLHRLARLHHALRRSGPASVAGARVWQGAARSISTALVFVLRRGPGRGIVALRVWDLAVLCEVGNRFGVSRTKAKVNTMPGILSSDDGSGIGKSDFMPFSSPATTSTRRGHRQEFHASSLRLTVRGGCNIPPDKSTET